MCLSCSHMHKYYGSHGPLGPAHYFLQSCLPACLPTEQSSLFHRVYVCTRGVGYAACYAGCGWTILDLPPAYVRETVEALPLPLPLEACPALSDTDARG